MGLSLVLFWPTKRGSLAIEGQGILLSTVPRHRGDANMEPFMRDADQSAIRRVHNDTLKAERWKVVEQILAVALLLGVVVAALILLPTITKGVEESGILSWTEPEVQTMDSVDSVDEGQRNHNRPTRFGPDVSVLGESSAGDAVRGPSADLATPTPISGVVVAP